MSRVRSPLIAVVVVIAGVVVACGERKTDRESATPAAAWKSLDVGWTKLADPPEMREGATHIWAGSELLAWGGCSSQVENDCVPTGDGFTFDPSTDTWTHIAEAPRVGAWADAVWTGEEAIFINLSEGALEGVAFDPTTDTWRTLPTGPVWSRTGGIQVWTGTELIVWGGGGPDDPTASNGAAYEPAADSWRRVADAPRGLNAASGMWTGTEVLVFGSLLDGRNWADTDTSVGLSYDPISDSWRDIPPSQLSPQATAANWIGGRMVAWDYDVHWQEYNPSGDQWSPPEPMPLQFSECYPDSVVVGDLLFAFFCGQAAVYDPALKEWTGIGGGPLEEETEAHEHPYKVWRFASLVPTGDVVFLSMQGITVEADGVPCYGCPGSPVSFWAYRIP